MIKALLTLINPFRLARKARRVVAGPRSVDAILSTASALVTELRDAAQANQKSADSAYQQFLKHSNESSRANRQATKWAALVE